MNPMTEYENTKNKILKYLSDREDYLKIYESIKNNINTLEVVIKPYSEYVPRSVIDTFLEHLNAVIEENSDVFDTSNRKQR